MKGNILACVSNVTNAEKLITKAAKLAKSFGVSCFVLTNDKNEYDELNFDLVYRKKKISGLCREHGANFVFIDNEKRKFADIVAENVEKHTIEHVLIGHPVKSKWEVIAEGSIVNELFGKLDDVDLHIVEVEKGVYNDSEQYERGVRVQVVEEDEKFEFKTEENQIGIERKAIFFQTKHTEFQNGILKIKKEDYIELHKVVNGEIFIEKMNEE